MITRDWLMATAIGSIEEIFAEDTPTHVRIEESLDELDRRLGFRRSALILQNVGTAPLLVGHARASADEADFRKDMERVQAILSSVGDRGVVRSSLSQTNDIILNDVTTDARYVAADELSAAEACLVEALSCTSSLALNVESSRPGVFTLHEVDFLASVLDFYAMVLSRSSSRLFDMQNVVSRAQATFH